MVEEGKDVYAGAPEGAAELGDLLQSCGYTCCWMRWRVKSGLTPASATAGKGSITVTASGFEEAASIPPPIVASLRRWMRVGSRVSTIRSKRRLTRR